SCWVARTRAPERLQEIADAALDVFFERGYRRARMVDVAEAAGVSPGLLYTYAENKEALFQLVILRAPGVEPDETALPSPTPDPEVAARFVIETVSWFANHRYGDYDGAQIDDGTARETVVQLVSAALVGTATRRR